MRSQIHHSFKQARIENDHLQIIAMLQKPDATKTMPL